MTDVQGLPEHHRAYIYARAAVLAEDTSTDALDALVRRGFTDAEELRMRDRRYLAARGTIIERGEDLAVLDVMSGRGLRPGTRGASLRVSFADAQEQRLGATPARPLSKLLGGGGLATWPLLTTLAVELGQAETAGRGRNRFREAGLCADNAHYQR